MVSHIPTWRNAQADIGTWAHIRTAGDYLRLVITPSIAAIDERMAELERTQDGAWAFEKSDLQDLREETLRGFALSLQAFWERQLRGYLSDCAREFGGIGTAEVQQANWVNLQQQFTDLRGLPPTRFAAFSTLDLLQRLGNVCRHGDGPSAERLKATHPELWASPHQTFAEVAVELQLLTEFVEAIVSFWTEAEDIYINSLKSKHPSTAPRLREAEQRWRGRA